MEVNNSNEKMKDGKTKRKPHKANEFNRKFKKTIL
jgi:hypothetical protein